MARPWIGFMLMLIASMGVTRLAASKTGAGDSPGASGEVVGYENLYEHEQYWPYHVRLTLDWKPEGFEGERFGHGIGVLVRVQSTGELRVDFGRFGRYPVPARVTNVIEEANRIRLGEKTKSSPNLVAAVGTRLLDPSTEPIRPVDARAFVDKRAYLLVAVDPASADFSKIVSALVAIRARDDVMAILFPQGGHKDGAVYRLCREAGWDDPFVFDRFTQPYTDSILGEDLALPSVALDSPEGRVMFSAEWSEEATASLMQAAARELGAIAAADSDVVK